MSDQYKGKYTHLILADVANKSLSVARVEGLQEDFAAHPTADPEYLASLDEALSILLGPEEIVKRMTARQGTEGEVKP